MSVSRPFTQALDMHRQKDSVRGLYELCDILDQLGVEYRLTDNGPTSDGFFFSLITIDDDDDRRITRTFLNIHNATKIWRIPIKVIDRKWNVTTNPDARDIWTRIHYAMR